MRWGTRFLVVAAIVGAVLGVQGWCIQGRTLTAAGQVGDAFAIFGLAALGLAWRSLRLQQGQIAEQSKEIGTQRALQKTELETLRTQAAAMTALVDAVRSMQQRASARDLAARYGTWLSALEALSTYQRAEAERQRAEFNTMKARAKAGFGSVVTDPTSETSRELRERRDRLAAASVDLLLLEDREDLAKDIVVLSRFPRLGERVPGKAPDHLDKFDRASGDHRSRLRLFARQMREHLRLAAELDLPGDEREMDNGREDGRDPSFEKPEQS